MKFEPASPYVSALTLVLMLVLVVIGILPLWWLIIGIIAAIIGALIREHKKKKEKVDQ